VCRYAEEDNACAVVHRAREEFIMKRGTQTTSNRVNRLHLSILLIVLLIPILVLSGCSNKKVTAVEDLFHDLTETYPGLAGMNAPDLSKQLKDVDPEKGSSENVTLNVTLPALNAVIDNAPEVDDANLAADADQGQDPIAALKRFYAAYEEASYVFYAAIGEKSGQTEDATIDIVVQRSDDGYTAEITDETGVGNFAAEREAPVIEAVNAAFLDSPYTKLFLARTISENVIQEALETDEHFADLCVLQSSEIKDGEMHFTVGFPNPETYLAAEADKVLADAKTTKDKVFGTVDAKTVVTKMDESNAAGKAAIETERSLEVADISFDLAGFASVDDPAGESLMTLDIMSLLALDSDAEAGDKLATVLDQVTIKVIDVSGLEGATIPDYDALRTQQAERILPQYTKLVQVKKVKTPKTKIISGKSSGQPITIKSKKGVGNSVVIFTKKGAKKPRLKVFVRNGKSITVRLPSGKYKMVQGFGSTWYGKTYMFGPSGRYEQSSKNITIKGGYRYTLTLYKISGGNLPTNSIPYSDL
jgi:uncharacterized protein with NRDE domain